MKKLIAMLAVGVAGLIAGIALGARTPSTLAAQDYRDRLEQATTHGEWVRYAGEGGTEGADDARRLIADLPPDSITIDLNASSTMCGRWGPCGVMPSA
jgi:hypothetical protein